MLASDWNDRSLPENHELPAVGVTVFQPDMSLLAPLISVAQASGQAVYLFIDGPIGVAIDVITLNRLKKLSGLKILHDQENRGVATGLNRLASAAVGDGFKHIVFFDQDSTLAPTLIGRLTENFCELRKMGENPAAVGPRPSSAIGSGTKPPHYTQGSAGAHGDVRSVSFLINSGMLISLDAYRQIGPFYEPYGMDSVDLEWCFRARSSGYSIWSNNNVDLPHRIGSGVIRIGPLAFPKQSETRVQSYIRNQAHLLMQQHTPWHWKVRTVLYIPLQALAFIIHSRHRRQTAAGIVGAMRAGLEANFRSSERSERLSDQS